MHRKIMRRFHSIIRDSGIRPGRALEVGGWAGDNSLLNVQELRDAERFCINLQDVPSGNGIVAVTGNANSMRMFADDSFDLVMSNATLEHDRCFWLSVAEMKRVLNGRSADHRRPRLRREQQAPREEGDADLQGSPQGRLLPLQ